ncbi:molybdenum cofactor cytidylyltransferase [Chloroflexota bacterium]
MSKFISAVILAAGSSRRLGRPKQLLPIGETTFLERTVDNILDSSVNEVIVVLGHLAEEMARLISRRPITVVVNPDYHQGMSTSVLAGLKLVNQEAQGVLFVLADQPLVDSETVNRLLENFGSQGKDIIIPIYKGRRGNPVVFSTTYKNELMQLTGDVGGRTVIARHPDRVLELSVDCEGVVIDVDSWDSYRLVTEKFRQEESS